MHLRKFSHGMVDQWSMSTDVFGLLAFMDLAVDKLQMDLLTWNVLAGMSDAIDPFLEVTGDDPFFSSSFELFPAASPDILALGFVLNLNERSQIAIDWEALNDTPEAVKFQISHRWQRACFAPLSAWELARIITPTNSVSIIKSIQTELTFANVIYRWPRGDSSYHKRELDATPGSEVGSVDVQWAVKVESLENNPIPSTDGFRQQAIINVNQWLQETPGGPHPEIAPWEEMLFLWGADHYVRLRCPPNSVVSLWICFRGPIAKTTGTWACGGMMKAQTQMLSSCRTYHNMTEMD
jgi:hypothetical protein